MCVCVRERERGGYNWDDQVWKERGKMEPEEGKRERVRWKIRKGNVFLGRNKINKS